MINSTTRSFVVNRASGRCEYCLVPESSRKLKFNIDHIIATQHQRNDHSENLCFCCPKTACASENCCWTRVVGLIPDDFAFGVRVSVRPAGTGGFIQIPKFLASLCVYLRMSF